MEGITNVNDLYFLCHKGKYVSPHLQIKKGWWAASDVMETWYDIYSALGSQAQEMLIMWIWTQVEFSCSVSFPNMMWHELQTWL